MNDELGKMKLHSLDWANENIRKLAEIFPNCVTETLDADGTIKRAIDYDQLRQELSDHIVDGPQERYHLNWPGKREALLAANAPIAKTLRPARAESVDFDTTQNLFIEGDNLEALKLLQETYLGKVKMIYIDPPYNTGNDFIYEDDFAESANEFLERSNQKDEDGNRLVANSDSKGRFHSDWLSMIYNRLKLARNLLAQDGVIFLSIANQEFSNLKKVCDEVFGETQFIECITWNKRIPKNDKGVGNIHDFILLYSKDSIIRHEFTMRKDGLEEIDDLLKSLKKNQVPLIEAEKQIRKLYKKQGYDRGITLYNSLNKNYKLWGKINMSWPNTSTYGPNYEILHPKTNKPVKIPDRGWRWKKETFFDAASIFDGKYSDIEELHDGSFLCGKVWFSKDENQQPSSVTFLDDVNKFLLRSILSLKSDGGIELENLFKFKGLFSNPKPTNLIHTLLSSIKSPKEDMIVLDFFAGSSTTAHAVMQLNAEDGSNRKFIMVQLPEECDPKSESAKAGYSNIAEISKERIRRAGAKILEGECHQDWNKDVGFRVLKVDTSNMKDVYYRPNEVDQSDLLSSVDNIKNGRTGEDLLFQVLVDWGVDLTLPIRHEKVDGKSVYFVDDDALIACFETGINVDFVKQLASHKPLRVVFRDNGFTSDDVKANVAQIFCQTSPDTDIKVI